MGLLTDDMTRLRGEVDALRSSREAFIEDMKTDVSHMQSDFRNDHAEMAGKLRDDLGTFVSELEANVSEMKAGFNNDHAEMARKLRDDLGTFVSELRQETTGLRGEFAADIAGARRAWFGPSPVKRGAMEEAERQQEEGRGLAGEKPAPRPEEEEEPQLGEAGSEVEENETTDDEVLPDDFTEIDGIGSARQKFLNEAGIYTFAQLAGSTPEELRQALGESSRLANVETWIEQAKELAE